ncbi:zinc-dependent alcohol dehydrogenase family protein [Rhodococcus sp. IEGM 1379]|uniref:zinc-dependent alcohol dehydrogenase family protein n=1 Tax=Rhodococcus sp. IEGM 1379 TaxID=3047086 RepID=UPI0024B68516|nr:zinc-dependent alcohol dehydrogenase family protein [Rhodococcus sp. IEGM 1379]MDI9914494.1 zinc-dependent alcohol dehydrogenase family protein [Rhodococcus sp. IEGM 1379]
MTAWQVHKPGPVKTHPLIEAHQSIPVPTAGQLLVRVLACGVCRTDLHVAEGDLPVHRVNVVPGHEIVGLVEEVGDAVEGFVPGNRVGIPWLHYTCGQCEFCLHDRENLCPNSTYTGWDVDGGYSEYALATAAFALKLPTRYTDAELAPLLCAGIIGFRALQRADVPAGGRLGIYGFGGSAHLAAQVAIARGAEVHVMTRSESARALATELGATSVQGADQRPPIALDSAILFAPVGDLVQPALEALNRGGILSIAGIHLSDIPRLNYQKHLFYEREIRSVTANTREDAREFLEFAAEHHLDVTTTEYPLANANSALVDLAEDRVTGAAVLIPDSDNFNSGGRT